MEQYTFFTENRGNILLVGYDKGQKKVLKRQIKPYMFVDDPKGQEYRTIKNTPVKKIDFNNTKEARDFIKEYEEISNVKIHGSTYFDYVYVNDFFKEIHTDTARIKKGNIDIETDSEGGYADVELADKEITSFQIKLISSKKAYVLGLKDFDPAKSEDLKREAPDYQVIHQKFSSEKAMIQAFIALWRRFDFDLVTGWNIEAYDIPYIIRRITRLFGEDEAKRLSPFKMIKSRKIINDFAKEQEIFEIVGVPVVDYMLAYKKFSFKNQESFKLDYICHAELKKKKLDYSEYGTLNNLYQQNSDKFYAYGVIDIIRIDELENKLKFLDLIITLAHFTRSNFLDSFATVKPVDVYIHNMLMAKKRVVPMMSKNEEVVHRKIAGGYVKEPLIGLHKNVMSFDFTSLYPHLIMCFNISPETYLGKIEKYDNLGNIEKVVDGAYLTLKQRLKEKNCVLTPKGTLFTKEFKGFLCEMMEVGFALRKQFKDQMQEYEKIDKDHPRVPEFNAKQQAVKIFLNSVYGSIANVFSRWFSYDIAESITISGQVSTKSVAKIVNERLKERLGIDKDFIIAADTDSIYVDISDLTNDDTSFDEYMQISDDISSYIEEACRFVYESCNVYQEKLHMKIECIGEALWRGAKNYVMLIWYKEGKVYDTPEVKMNGIEAVKSSTPEICRDKIKECIPLIIKNNGVELKKTIDDFRDFFYSQPFERVGKPSGVSDVDKYHNITKGVPYHVRASIAYNNFLKKNGLDKIYPLIVNGDKIKLCYLLEPNKIGQNVLACPDSLPKEFEIDEYIDYRKQFEKAFLSPIQSLANVAGIDLSGKGDISEFFA